MTRTGKRMGNIAVVVFIVSTILYLVVWISVATNNPATANEGLPYYENLILRLFGFISTLSIIVVLGLKGMEFVSDQLDWHYGQIKTDIDMKSHGMKESITGKR